MKLWLWLQILLVVVGIIAVLVWTKPFSYTPVGVVSITAPSGFTVNYDRQVLDGYLKHIGYWDKISWIGKARGEEVPASLQVDLNNQKEEEWYVIKVKDATYSSFGFYFDTQRKNTIRIYLSSQALSDFASQGYQGGLGGSVLTSMCLETETVAKTSMSEAERLNMCGKDAFSYLSGKNSHFLKLSKTTAFYIFQNFNFIQPVYADYCGGTGTQYCGTPTYDCACSSDSSVCSTSGKTCPNNGGTCTCNIFKACSYGGGISCSSIGKTACGVNDCAHPECYIPGGCYWVVPTAAPTATPPPGSTPVPTTPPQNASCSGWCTNAGDTCQAHGLPTASGTCSNGGQCCGQNNVVQSCGTGCCDSTPVNTMNFTCLNSTNQLKLDWQAVSNPYACINQGVALVHSPDWWNKFYNQNFSSPASTTTINIDKTAAYQDYTVTTSGPQTGSNISWAAAYNPITSKNSSQNGDRSFSCTDRMGQVKNQNGTGIAGAQVDIYKCSTAGYCNNGSGTLVTTETTDANGYYYLPYGSVFPPSVATRHANDAISYGYMETSYAVYPHGAVFGVASTTMTPSGGYDSQNTKYQNNTSLNCAFPSGYTTHPYTGACNFTFVPYPTVAVTGSLKEISGTDNICSVPISAPNLTMSLVSGVLGVSSTCTVTQSGTTASGYSCNVTFDNGTYPAVPTGALMQVQSNAATYSSTSFVASGVCSSSAPSTLTVNSGMGTINQDVQFGGGPWIKLRRTSFNKVGNLTNEAPINWKPYDSDDFTAAQGGAYLNEGWPGIVTVQGAANLGTTWGTNQQAVSSLSWLKEGYSFQSQFSPSTFESYLQTRKDYKTATKLSDINSTNTIWVVPGPITLSDDSLFTATGTGATDGLVLIVNGNVTISEPVFNTNNYAVAILSTGQIEFTGTTTEAHGIFIGSSSMIDARNPLDNTGMKIVGNLISSAALTQNRTRTDTNYPTVFLFFQPSMYTRLLPLLSTQVYDWTQVQ